MILKYKKILTFFAHPDDETLAAGATINKLSKNGCRVYVAIPGTGIHARKNIQNATICILYTCSSCIYWLMESDEKKILYSFSIFQPIRVT